MMQKNIREIKSLMVLRGIKNVDIAKRLGVSPTWVSLVLCGHETSGRVRIAIAEAIGKQVCDIWPKENGKGTTPSS